MQGEIVAGATLDFTQTVPNYPATAGWVLKYWMVPRDATAVVVTLVAIPVGNDYRVQATPPTTGSWMPGWYGWFSRVERPGASYDVDRGQVEVKPNPAAMMPGTDTRSLAQKTVDDLRAALATYQASNGHIQSYTIGNRSMTYRSAEEIITAINKAESDLFNENVKERLARGLGNPRKIGIRFQRL